MRKAEMGFTVNFRNVILSVVITSQVCGCAWMKSRWPWSKKDVPVNTPNQTSPWETEEKIPETSERQAESQPAPQPPAAAVRDRRPAPTTGKVSTAPSSPPVKPRIIGDPEIVAASLLQVNNRFFSIDDIIRAAEPRLAKLPKGLSPLLLRQRIGEIIATTIRDEVGQTLVLERASRYLTEHQTKRIEAEVQERLKGMIAETDGSRKKLEKTLQSEGTTLALTLDSHRDAMKVQYYLRSKFASAITVNRRMLWEYYRRHRDEFTSPKKVQMRIIAAPVKVFAGKGGTTTAPAKLQAEDAVNKAAEAVRKGEDFGDVAKRISRGVKAPVGGLWPLMPAGSFREAKVEKAAFALVEGQVSEIIETPAGFFIVKAERVVPRKIIRFERAQAGIEKHLRAEQYRKLTDKYFDELYKSASILRSDQFLDLTVDRAVAKYLSP